MTRKAILIAPIIPLAAQRRTTSAMSPATVGGTREPVSASRTLTSSACPGTTDASHRAIASRCSSGSSASATAVTNETSGTSENSTRYEIAAANCDVAWRV